MRNAAGSLFALLVCSSIFAAGHEITPPVLGPSPLAALNPSVATNGETFATVWTDGTWLYGALADSSGRRLTAGNVAIMRIAPQQCCGGITAAVTAVGRDYVVFWSNATNSYLTTLGTDLEAVRTTLLTGVPPLTFVSVASNADQILVAGATGNIFPPAKTVAYLFSRDGSIARGPMDLGSLPSLRASWSGSAFLVAHATNSGVFLHRVGSTDIQITSPADGKAYNAAVATSGDVTVVVWTQGTTFWSASVTSDGSVSKRQIDSHAQSMVPPIDIVRSGETFVATFGNLVYRLDGSGAVASGPVDVGQTIEQIASAGDALYAVTLNLYQPNSASTALHTTTGIDHFQSEFLSMTAAAQQDPSIASDGLDFLAVFRENTAAARSMKAALVRRMSATPANEPVSLASVTSTFAADAVAHGSTIYVAVWADSSGIFARRVSNEGFALDPQPISISTDQYSTRPDIAWDGQSFVVVWAGKGGIKVATMREDGSVGPTHIVATDGSMEPRIAWNGKVFLVVYGVPQWCPFECIPGRAMTEAVRVAADGTAIDSTPAIIDQWQSPGPMAARATVASNGSDFLLALDKTDGASIVHLNTDGPSIVVGQPVTVFAWFTLVTNDIRWNGHEYVLASVYGTSPDKQWLAITRLSWVNRVSTPVTVQPATIPALATNFLGENAVVLSEYAGSPAVPRAHIFFDSDFAAAPPPPAPPKNVTASGNAGHFTMTWETGADAEAVVIQIDHGTAYTQMFAVPTTQRTQTFNDPTITSVVLRTANAGGMSEAVGALLQLPARRRATR